MRYLYFLIVISFSAYLSAAEIYLQKDAHGNVIYSDTPSNANAIILNIPSQNANPSSTLTQETPTIPNQSTPPSVPAPAQTTGASVSQPDAVLDTSATVSEKQNLTFIIESPKDQETIYNQPVIPVKIIVQPELRKGDKIALLLDGKPSGLPLASTQLELNNVDRGTHTLSAVLIDSNNQIIKHTNSITLYVHKTSIRNTLTSPSN